MSFWLWLGQFLFIILCAATAMTLVGRQLRREVGAIMRALGIN